MTTYYHIERSGFRAGEYVGYSCGRRFRITRVLSGSKTIGWEARAALGSYREGGDNYLLAPSLRGLDAQLAGASSGPHA